MTAPVCVMLVAAEPSGDALGAELARALRRRLGADKVRFVGVGGARMAAEGVESPFDIADLAILGLFEGLMAYPRVVARAKQAAALAAREKPDIAVLIDSWGFTLRVAGRLRAQDPTLPLVKYVGPQVWASRPGRARVLAKAVDHLLAIHSFDPPHFEKAGLKTTFVGNPHLQRDFASADGARFRASIGAGPDDPVLLVLPGSRPGEIQRIMPPFEDAIGLLMDARPELKVALPIAPSVAEAVHARLAAFGRPVHLVEGDEAKADAMKGATVALACSGTVTTELALAGCPMVVGYRVGAITYYLLKALILTPYITLLNIAAGKAVAPEMIQHDCNGPDLAREIGNRLDDPALRARQIAEQNAALDKMGRGQADPSERAADVIAGMLA
jgi:lipid-A-disaccharide synthase